MTDEPIPQVYLDEAMRRLNEEYKQKYDQSFWSQKDLDHPTVAAFARTLQELGWKPPVDPMLVRAREIAARTVQKMAWSTSSVASVRNGDSDNYAIVQAVLIALREGMGND